MTLLDTMKFQNEPVGADKNHNYASKATFPYEIIRIVGQGTFGKVYEATNSDNKRVAIKKVEKSSHFISREYDILKVINHPNCLKLLDMYMTNEENKKMQYLVFDFIPYTLASLLKKKQLSLGFIRVLFYQLCLSIKHIHAKFICHRDITPNNILLNAKGELVLADFGSAKILEHNHTSMSYICSRYYRAPELLVGCQTYTTKIDIWSIGCILAEMLKGKPVFPGTNSADQFARIIDILGSPSHDDMEAMRPSKSNNFHIPTVKSRFNDTFSNVEDKEVLDLLSKILILDPTKRASIEEILAHPFLHNVNLNSLELFDEMKCFTKMVSQQQQQSSAVSSSSAMSATANSGVTTASSTHLSKMNTGVTTSSNNLNINMVGGNKNNSTNNSNASLLKSQAPLSINTI
ncbi:hypothetical protein SAMD00019534_098130 [Acytostelium subglobosum LB1]|uniref:hypothetical protein n=1 Tax=Acytostelium subglobosum LB1 TaxID=1410327 RepID=UPI0006449007|nr:hypothetical protein SAMD00019534_098130 [Acytostelium subglobosum LB1]GAM26638.1 hypothetical protein SAMD00019534_098130 [Acytostelium subglobosum LB1]|eukprot:XP_012750299.1 hypothetical protein SAMD00019534_098130 [Acytostelium subglobosum LB1]